MRKLFIALCVLWLASCGNSPRLLWRFKTGGRIYGAPIVFNQLVLAGSTDSCLYALDLKTGKEVWKKNFGTPLFSGPRILNNVLYIGTGKGDFVAMEPATGHTLWTVSTGNVIEYLPCADDQGLFFGNNLGTFTKVGLDGKVLWQVSFHGKFSGSCEVRGNFVYTSCWDKNFYALDRSTGSVVWKQPSGTFNFSGPLFQENRVWFVSHEHLFCFDVLTGAAIFKREVAYSNTIVPWKGLMWTPEKHRICKRDNDGNLLLAVDFNSGPLQPVPLNNVLLVSDDRNALFGLSPELKVVWKFTGGEIFTGGALDAGFFYAGNLDGCIYAIRLPQ